MGIEIISGAGTKHAARVSSGQRLQVDAVVSDAFVSLSASGVVFNFTSLLSLAAGTFTVQAIRNTSPDFLIVASGITSTGDPGAVATTATHVIEVIGNSTFAGGTSPGANVNQSNTGLSAQPPFDSFELPVVTPSTADRTIVQYVLSTQPGEFSQVQTLPVFIAPNNTWYINMVVPAVATAFEAAINTVIVDVGATSDVFA